MKLEHVNEDQIKSDLRRILKKYVDLSEVEVFVFGSRVTGEASERSDIDIGLEGTTPISGATMEHIRDEIEDLPYLYTIQIVDFKRVSERFYQTAKQATEPVVYE